MYKDIIIRLLQDEVITLESTKQANELYDYMVEHDIDPERFRREGLEIWIG